MQMLVQHPPSVCVRIVIHAFQVYVQNKCNSTGFYEIFAPSYFGVLNYPTSGEFPVFGIMFQKLCHKNVLTKNNEEKAYFPSVALYKIIYLC